MKSLLARLSFATLFVAGLSPAALHAAADYSTPYVFTTLAGTSSIGSQDGSGTAARFFSPRDVATDAQGNIFVVDQGNHTIRKISATGTVSTFAGSPGEEGSRDGIGGTARFNDPRSIVADATGNLFVADTGNHTIRKITPAGEVTTLTGRSGVTGNTNGTGTIARFNRPMRIAIAASGVLFVADLGNQAIRKITPDGVVSHYATASFAEITGDVSLPFHALAVDTAGDVHAAHIIGGDTVTHQPTWGDNYTIFAGSVSRFPSASAPQFLWSTSWTKYFDGRTINRLCSDLEFDHANNAFAVDGPTLRRASSGTWGFMLLAGDGTHGSIDGPAASAKFGFPLAITLDRAGTLYIADTGNNIVRKLSPAGEVTTIAGLALEKATGTLDGTAGTARFASPAGTAIDTAGNVYVAEPETHCIRRITPDGVVTTLAGRPGQSGSEDGVGSAARFNRPVAITLGPDGALYVSDSSNHVIRRVTTDGTTTTFAGLAAASGWGDGPRLTARLMFPNGLQFDSAGNLYVVSAATVRKITPAGDVTTLAGLNNETGYVDDTGSAARFTNPLGLAVDSAGIVYVTEATTSPSVARIRKIFPTGAVRTLAGMESGYIDGAAANARFDYPVSLAVDANGNLFVADRNNQVIRKISAAGAVSTVAGLLDAAGNADGVGRNARFYYPQGITVDPTGNLYVTSGTTVRKGVLTAGPSITTQPLSQSVTTGASVTFSVTAAGTPEPTYQWQFNGTPISGATSPTFSLSAVRAADAGDYTVVVSNELGSVTSNKATLTVTAPPPPSPPPPASGGGGGGGGAPSLWFFAALLPALARRFLQRS